MADLLDSGDYKIGDDEIGDYEIAFGEHADRHSASDEYALRFSGKIGQWLLDIQSQILREFVQSSKADSCLDIGGGHAQVVSALHSILPTITVLVSASDAAGQLQKGPLLDKAKTIIGRLSASGLPARSYDLVTCIRIMSHSHNWKALVAEICRVADKRVIIDYPLRLSFNLLEPLLFNFKKNLEGNTRKYLLFSQSEIENEFALHNFKIYRIKKQFFFPMVLHRAMSLPLISTTVEKLARCLGLTALYGSPCIVEFRRVKDHNVK